MYTPPPFFGVSDRPPSGEGTDPRPDCRTRSAHEVYTAFTHAATFLSGLHLRVKTCGRALYTPLHGPHPAAARPRPLRSRESRTRTPLPVRLSCSTRTPTLRRAGANLHSSMPSVWG